MEELGSGLGHFGRTGALSSYPLLLQLSLVLRIGTECSLFFLGWRQSAEERRNKEIGHTLGLSNVAHLIVVTQHNIPICRDDPALLFLFLPMPPPHPASQLQPSTQLFWDHVLFPLPSKPPTPLAQVQDFQWAGVGPLLYSCFSSSSGVWCKETGGLSRVLLDFWPCCGPPGLLLQLLAETGFIFFFLTLCAPSRSVYFSEVSVSTAQIFGRHLLIS